MSSSSYQETTSVHGLFDGDQALNNLWAYNKLYVKYCSSDGWIGDALASGNSEKLTKTTIENRGCFEKFL